MRVLCISNYYPPFFEGGYEISVKETMDYLAQMGHETYVLCGRKGIADEDLARNPGEVVAAAVPDKPIRVLKYIDYRKRGFWAKHQVERYNYIVTKKLIAQINPDIVYMGNMKTISIAPVIATQNAGVPRVYDVGDLWPGSYLQKGFSGAVKRFLKAILPFTIGGRIVLDPVIVLSRWMMDEVKSKYGSKEIFVVPRGIRLPVETARHTFDRLRFVYAGRIEPMKGLDLCIKALPELLMKIPNVDFVLDIYGEEDHSYGKHCRDLIDSYGLQKHFRFMGRSENMMSILPDYDVLLMPTLAREAFGRIIIEAMAFGLIVVSTRAFGPREIIEDEVDGLLFERSSVSGLAMVLIKLLSISQEELLQISDRARAKVNNHYEISLVKNQIVIIIESIIKQSISKHSEV